MTAVDRLGFHVRMKTEEGMKGARIAFLGEVTTPGRNQEDAGGHGAAGTPLVNYCPDLLYSQGAFNREQCLLVGQDGRILPGDGVGVDTVPCRGKHCFPVSSTPILIRFSG